MPLDPLPPHFAPDKGSPAQTPSQHSAYLSSDKRSSQHLFRFFAGAHCWHLPISGTDILCFRARMCKGLGALFQVLWTSIQAQLIPGMEISTSSAIPTRSQVHTTTLTYYIWLIYPPNSPWIWLIYPLQQTFTQQEGPPASYSALFPYLTDGLTPTAAEDPVYDGNNILHMVSALFYGHHFLVEDTNIFPEWPAIYRCGIPISAWRCPAKRFWSAAVICVIPNILLLPALQG